jgi:hypothetical protein
MIAFYSNSKLSIKGRLTHETQLVGCEIEWVPHYKFAPVW